MIHKNEGAIGIRELMSIIFMMIGLKHTDLTPLLLYSKGENAAWIIILIAGILLVLPFTLILQVMKAYETKNLMEVIFQLLGKKLGFLIGLGLMIVTFLATIIDSRSYADIISTLYLRKTPLVVIYLFFLATSFYIAKRGLQAIGRVAYLMTPIIIVISFLIFLLLGNDLVWERMHPLFGPGYWELAKQGFLKTSIFGDIFMLTFLYPFVRNHKSFKLGTYIGLGTTWIVLMSFYVMYVALFNFPSVENVTYPFHEAMRYIDITPALTNNEVFFFAFWLYTSLIRFSVYLYVLSIIFSSLFGINEFEPLILPLSFITLMLGMLPENAIVYELLIREKYILNPATFMFIGLPILLWITAKWKGVLK